MGFLATAASVIAPVASIVSTGAGIAANVSATKKEVQATELETEASIKALRYRRQVARRNAQLAEENARESWSIASGEAQIRDLYAAQVMGEEKARQSASGLRMSSPTMQQRTGNQAKLAARDRKNIIIAGGTEAREFLRQRREFRDEEAILQDQEKYAEKASAISVASAIMGGRARTVGMIGNFVERL